MSVRRMVGRRGVLAVAAALAGCQTPGVSPADITPRLSATQTGYIAIQAPIVNRLRDLFIADADKLLNQNAKEIYVLINSPGGDISAAQDMIAYIDRIAAERNVRFVMHNIGVVASAACYVFLAGQRRLSIPGGTFLFHEAAVVSNGPITSQNMQEGSIKIQQIERSFLATLTAKTKLSEAEAASFVRRTVILSTDEARRDGIIEAAAPFRLPTGASIFQIMSTPNRTGVVRQMEPR